MKHLNDIKLKSIIELRKDINKLMRTNNGTNAEERVKILYKNAELLEEIKIGANQVSSAKFNRYIPLLNQLNRWVLDCKSKEPKDYKQKLTYRNEMPSEIKDNMKTSQRIYQGKSNFYTGGTLKPTKEDLKDPYIQQQVTNLKWLRSNLKNKAKNRIKISEFIKQTKDDLTDALKSKHGINHQGRTDNTPSPQAQHRISRYQLHQLLQYPMARAIYQGYTQAEIAKVYGIDRSTVGKRLKKLKSVLE